MIDEMFAKAKAGTEVIYLTLGINNIVIHR